MKGWNSDANAAVGVRRRARARRLAGALAFIAVLGAFVVTRPPQVDATAAMQPASVASPLSYPPACGAVQTGHAPGNCLENQMNELPQSSELSLTISPRAVTMGQKVTITWSSALPFCYGNYQGRCISTGSFVGFPNRYIPAAPTYHPPSIQLPADCNLPLTSHAPFQLSCAGPLVGGSGPVTNGQVLANHWIVVQSTMYVTQGGLPARDTSVAEAAFYVIGPGTPSVTGVKTAGGGSSGPLAGNTQITVSGSGFGSPGDVDQVNLVPQDGGTAIAATNVQVVDDGTITAWTGAAPAPPGGGSVVTDVQVVAAGTASPLDPPDDQFTYAAVVVDRVVREHDGNSVVSPCGCDRVSVFGSGFELPHASVEVDFCLPPDDTSCKRAPQDELPAFGPPVVVSDSEISAHLGRFTVDDSPFQGATSKLSVDLYVVLLDAEGEVIAKSPKPTAPNLNFALHIDTLSLATGSPAGGPLLDIKGAGFGIDTVGVAFCPAPMFISAAAGFNPSCIIVANSLSYDDSAYPYVREPFGFGPNGDSEREVSLQVPWLRMGSFGLLSSETVNIQILAGGGYVTVSPPVQFTYRVAVSSVTPTPVSGGGAFTVIRGQGFGTDNTRATVQFCRDKCETTGAAFDPTFKVVSDQEIDLTLPDLSQLPGDPNKPLEVRVVLSIPGLFTLATSDFYTPLQAAQAPACNALQDCQGATNGDPGGTAIARSTTATGEITAEGTGTGGVTVGRYASNPAGAPSFAANGSYFDVAVSTPNAFTALTIKDCDLHGGNGVRWWDPNAGGGSGAWLPVSPVTFSAGPPACLTLTVDAASSPTLAQLTGTVFAVVSPAPVPPPIFAPPVVIPAFAPAATGTVMVTTTATPPIDRTNPVTIPAAIASPTATPVTAVPHATTLGETPTAVSTPIAPATGSGIGRSEAGLEPSILAFAATALATGLTLYQLEQRRRRTKDGPRRKPD